MKAIVPGTLFTNEGNILFSLITFIDNVDSAYVWRWGYGISGVDDEWDIDDTGRNSTMCYIEYFTSWTKTYPVKVLWRPDVHCSSK